MNERHEVVVKMVSNGWLVLDGENWVETFYETEELALIAAAAIFEARLKRLRNEDE